MKKTLLALLLAAITLSSCNWKLSDDDADLDDVVITTKTETAQSVEKVSTFRNGELSCYVVRFVSNTSTREVDQEQYYKADGTLQYCWKYGRNAEGLVTMAVYYDAAKKLSHYYRYAYGPGDTVTTQAEYSSSDTLAWLRRYETNASGGIGIAASFNASLVFTGALQYYYIDGSSTWNMEIAYGKDSGSLAGDITVDNPSAGEVTTSSLEAEDRIPLSPPADHDLPEPAIPDLALSGLSVSGYRFSFDDGHGNTLVSLDKDYFPLSGTRTDDRIGDKVRIELTYDGEKRIAGKETYYGSTLALGITVEYLDDTLYPVRVETSGKSMMMPLDYEIEYGDNREIESVGVYSGDTRIRSFVYEYETPAAGLLSAREVRGMDPFAFLGDMLRAGVTILEYDGDGALIETFTASSSATGVAVEVRLPTDAGEPGGAVNGSFRITYDDEGNCSSIAAYAKDGKEVWREEVSLFTDMWDDLEAAATTSFDEAVDYGSMVETMISGNASNVTAKVQENFVYNLLF